MSDTVSLDRQHAWHPYTQHGLEEELLPVVGAAGAWLELADGRELLDGISSWWCCLHGHGHPRLVAALQEQAARLDHVLYAGCTHEPAARLAAELVEMAAPLAATDPAREAAGGLTRAFYSDDGSTAVEAALKMAYGAHHRRGQPARTTFLAVEGGYHGDTFGAMSAGDPDPFFADYAPFLFHVVRVKPDAEELAAAFADLEGRVAGFLLEPMLQGAAGMVPHSADFLRAARRLCDEHGAFLIADEVMTGFGRTGRTFACEHGPVCPDLLCLSKGLTGGMLPLSVTMATEAIYEAFLSDQRGRAFFHGHTFTANPIGCAVARESLALVREERVPERLERIGDRIHARLADLAELPQVAELRRLGGMVALELAAEDAGYLAGLGERLRAACRELPAAPTDPAVSDASATPARAALLRPLGNVLYALPPACLDQEECDFLASAMRAAIMRA